MNIEDIDAMYEATFNKNQEIQNLLVDVKDFNDILAFLYETEIRRPNLTLNSLIDDYESLILKLREAHNEIISSLEEFGREDDIARDISENGALSVKTKELVLWKLRRLYMVYDEEPILPYTEGAIANVEVSSDGKVVVPEGEEAELESDSDEEETINPNGDVFPAASEEKVED